MRANGGSGPLSNSIMTVRLSVVVSPSNGVQRTARTGGVKPAHEITATRSRAPPASVLTREPHLHPPPPVPHTAILPVPNRVQAPDPADEIDGEWERERGVPYVEKEVVA